MSSVLKASPGAPGLAIGPLARLASASPMEAAVDPRTAAERLGSAQAHVAQSLEQLAAELRAAGKPDEAAIFEAQAMLAADPALAEQVLQLHAEAGDLAAAVTRAAERVALALAAIDDPYLRARAEDMRAVARQIAQAVSGAVTDVTAGVPSGAIVLAGELSPAELMQLHKHGVAGLVLEGGTSTGHVAILARALALPLLVGAGELVQQLPETGMAVLDGGDGTLVVGPSDVELATYQERRAAARVRSKELARRPAIMADGHRVQLWANIGHPDEAAPALERGAEGIGLFRTEWLFLDRASAPSEDEQYAAYTHTLEAMHGQPVIVRTLDVGGDKPIPYLPPRPEANPFLGTRGIRFARQAPELFETQVRALLRAAQHGDLRIMLPMVATPDDVRWAYGVLQHLASELKARPVPLGIMVETPAAAVSLDRLQHEVTLAFCSVGSNDLAQYTLAADRSNSTLATSYPYDDPAVFRLIRTAAQAARSLGLEISVCGELAADPRHALALVGLGIDKLSMAPAALDDVKERLLASSFADAQQQAALACADS